jgi:hypothetical protein
MYEYKRSVTIILTSSDKVGPNQLHYVRFSANDTYRVTAEYKNLELVQEEESNEPALLFRYQDHTLPLR